MANSNDLDYKEDTLDTAAIPDMPDDKELAAIFLEEAKEIIDNIDNAVEKWKNKEKGAAIYLQRLLHTLKGGSRMAGYHHVGDLSHILEALIIKAVDIEATLSPGFFNTLHQAFYRLHVMITSAIKSEPVYPERGLIENLEEIRNNTSRIYGEPSHMQIEMQNKENVKNKTLHKDDIAYIDLKSPLDKYIDETGPLKNFESNNHEGHIGRIPKKSLGELVKIQLDLLDKLINYTGEIGIYQARLSQKTGMLISDLHELDQTIKRLGSQLRKMEIEAEAQVLSNYVKEQEKAFDPLELDRYSILQQLSRALSESLNDVINLKDSLTSIVQDSEIMLLQQSRVNIELQEGLMSTRMVQFSTIVPRLRRIVRQTAAEMNCQAELRVTGEYFELDRSLLERVTAPLEHMVRNAIAHGIEHPEKREQKNKPITGLIEIDIAREGGEIIIVVEDDGSGIDIEMVRSKAVKQGLILEKQELSDHEIMQFILTPGFSTAKQVTQVSGRGIGMDVVNNEISQLNGLLNINSVQGKGTRFTVQLPLTLTITQALLVHVGEAVYAVPLASIEGVVRLFTQELKDKYSEESPFYCYADNNYALHYIGVLLETTKPNFANPNLIYPIILIRSGAMRIALHVDSFIGRHEIVLKPLGRYINRIQGISGATTLGDGRIALVLDVPNLIRFITTEDNLLHVGTLADDHVQKTLATIMVVDDSVTIRKVMSRMLERHDFAVIMAKDGLDAISQLEEAHPDLILLDVEMPRMDGYEFATYVRNHETLSNIPIIMITSRTGEKHRQRAIEIGVNGYFGKPYQEADLITAINDTLLNEVHT